MVTVHPNTVVQNGRLGNSGSSGSRIQFVISQREPWHLPDENIELPSPESLSGTPPTINWLAALLPPVLMLGVVGIYSQFAPPGQNNTVMFIMPLMSMAFPIVNIVSYFSQKKRVQEKTSCQRATLSIRPCSSAGTAR